MENQFANVQHHVGDVYVADYTQFASEHPEHSDKVPFSAFVLSQDELMAYKDLYNSVIISDNVVDIWTGTVIKLPVY